MNKNVLAFAVAATVAGGAYAQQQPGIFLNAAENTGEVLVFPYYTADGGNDTYIHIVNTTDISKAVKVRILEAENSVEVRDFNLYLSPKDHFSFAITLADTGGAKLVTADNSCTVPRIKADGEATGEVEFTNLLLENDENPSIERTLNGHIEVIEMGQFYGDIAANWTHGADGVPADCDELTALWTQGGTWAEQAETDLVGFEGEAPAEWDGGGLYGMGTVINVQEGTSFGYDATAIENYVNEFAVIGSAELHFPPGDTRPSLGVDQTVIASLSNTSTIFNEGQALTYDYIDPLDAVSSVMMAETVMNDYVIDPAVMAATDWVITFPTKRFYVNQPVVAWAPFTDIWDGNDACEPFRLTVYDREEQFVRNDPNEPQFSPFIPEETPDLEICYETNVISMTADSANPEGSLYNDGSMISDSTTRIWYAAEPGFDAGWAEISFDWDDLIDQPAEEIHLMPNSGGTLSGLPTVGFGVIEYTNGTLAGGTLANYASAYEHKTDVVFSTGGGVITDAAR